MWGLGLTDTLMNQITESVGPGFHVRNFPADALPGVRELNQEEQPSTAWIPWTVWSGLSGYRKEQLREQDATQRILIQDDPGPGAGRWTRSCPKGS